MTDDDLLESIDRHFLAGCPDLSTSQLAQHRARGSCPECAAAGMTLAAAVSETNADKSSLL